MKKKSVKKTGKAKYEMNLAEFPVTVLSKRVSKDKKAIKYTDWIIGRDGKKERREWTVTGSAEWGLPTGSALRTLFELINIWKEQGFRERKIYFGSRYNLLRQMGSKLSKRDYERIEKDLNCLVGITIRAKKAFWDKELEAYIDKTFHLFEELNLYRQDGMSEGGKTQQTLPFAYIKASEVFHNAIKKGNILTIDSELFRKLTAPTEQRLALYLSKMLRKQSVHKRDIFKLAEQLPIYEKYPSQIKRTLNKALKSLMDKGFSLLESYYYEKSSDGKSENIVFVKAKQRTKPRGEVEGYKVKALVDDMLRVLGDEKSRGFYTKIAKLCPQDMIYRALSETKQDYSDSSIRKSRGAIFTEKIKRYAKEAGIDLGLSSSKKDPLTKREREAIKEVEKAFGGIIKFVDKDKNGKV